jgi:hypothetical protein
MCHKHRWEASSAKWIIRNLSLYPLSYGIINLLDKPTDEQNVAGLVPFTSQYFPFFLDKYIKRMARMSSR